jgi:hypothetical protein
MKTQKGRCLLIFMVSLFLLFTPKQTFPLSHIESLEGLKGVEVIVEELKPELEDYNLSVIQIQKEVEAKLQSAGINVLTKEDNEKIQPSRQPYLYIKISSCKLPARRPFFAFYIDFALNQRVKILGNTQLKKYIFYCPTWYKSELGAVSGKELSNIIEIVKALTEKFIKDFQTANLNK